MTLNLKYAKKYAEYHLEPVFVVYAWNMPGIYHVYVDVLHIHGIYYIHGISMDSPYISIEMDIHGISMDIPCISTQ
jgi:hypothetical protein